jgi:hypothetical protein
LRLFVSVDLVADVIENPFSLFISQDLSENLCEVGRLRQTQFQEAMGQNMFFSE